MRKRKYQKFILNFCTLNNKPISKTGSTKLSRDRANNFSNAGMTKEKCGTVIEVRELMAADITVHRNCIHLVSTIAKNRRKSHLGVTKGAKKRSRRSAKNEKSQITCASVIGEQPFSSRLESVPGIS